MYSILFQLDEGGRHPAAPEEYVEAYAAMRPHVSDACFVNYFDPPFGIICMVMIVNWQYSWTLFVNPIDQNDQWGRTAIQVAFTIFVVTEMWLVPFEG